eukprot:CAMPEP_0118709500 /NCGR_PEP_ID=MMETSP0800-20121206/22688_1 /TAXON_ID=210618 ORGANISM="Striatella unipunctata, Strain CCMP2910" /NCGR_SAMPLE_ID=MMETSP0800 /ASSEMBLY_ACC=CAM_ASM_000638 /LENGTH=104 /DNA_ID=CAMNT_0006613233 /DNA_START=19 /DNA_END=333 /DNA_ORIENTATION=-
MAPRARSPSFQQGHISSFDLPPVISEDALVEEAAKELNILKESNTEKLFPPACLMMVRRTIAGNGKCLDCGCHAPDWATPTYGALLCINCSGRHRGFGVQVNSN